MKVHKDPFQMHPIICCSGTFMNQWSKWLDHQLQKLKPFVSSYLRDSQQLLDEITLLQLPSNARLFTANGNSMYNNIETDHAIKVISWWLDDLYSKGKLPASFPIEAVKSAMVTIMKNNIFMTVQSGPKPTRKI